MSDFDDSTMVKWLRADEWPGERQHQREARWSLGARLADVADRIERLREIALTAELMLSELGLSADEKCQMAYDYLHDNLKPGDGA